MASSAGSRRRLAGSSTNAAVVYPNNCEEVHEEMDIGELARRLATLAVTFQSMSQKEDEDGNDYGELVPLSLHLAKEGFINHSNGEIRLLIGSCIADIIRIYASEVPYKDAEQVKVIFKFLISQLEGLKNPQDEVFELCVHILDTLAVGKSFGMCYVMDLDNRQDVLCSLFDLLLSIVNRYNLEKVKSSILALLCPLLLEDDNISNKLISIILRNIVQPLKSFRSSLYNVTKELIIKCSKALEPHVQNFFHQNLSRVGNGDHIENLQVGQTVYVYLYELNEICPSLFPSAIPQLEEQLKSSNVTDRMCSVSLLARIFSEKGSKLTVHHASLWQTFLSRFNDISKEIRKKCVQYSIHFLVNHPELRDDIVAALRLRQHDSDEVIRLEVVKTVVATAKCDVNIVYEREEMLSYLKKRTLDVKFEIRREALEGLGLIYKKHLDMENVPDSVTKTASWMKDQILHGYYTDTLADKILTEHLLTTYLVPYHLKPNDRMIKLFYLYATIDNNAASVCMEIQKSCKLIRRYVAELLSVIKKHNETNNRDDYEKQINSRIVSMVKFFPDPLKASEFMYKFCIDLKEDRGLMRLMDSIVASTTDCETCVESVNMVLKKLGPPVMTNLYYCTIKVLLERISYSFIDQLAVKELMVIVTELVETLGKEDNHFKSWNVPKEDLICKGLTLISKLASIFPSHFDNENTLGMLIELLKNMTSNEALAGNDQASLILSALFSIGKVHPIGDAYPLLMEFLATLCLSVLRKGCPRQGKLAVLCLCANITDEVAKNHMIAAMLKIIRKNLRSINGNYSTAIVALGHVALYMSDEFAKDIKKVMSQRIVRELLIHPQRSISDYSKTSGSSWCDKEDLPEITKCMLYGMKTMARWVVGLKDDVIAASSAFKLMTAFVNTGGRFINPEVPFSNSELAWLRLTAGSCMLKICEQERVGDAFTAFQFVSLSKLVTDDLQPVRSRFINKLHKGLNDGIPFKCIPLDFLGFYALIGLESDEELKNRARTFMMIDVIKRRKYIDSLVSNAALRGEELIVVDHVIPDYILAFAVAVLTHCTKFTNPLDENQLSKIWQCLWFILEPHIHSDMFPFAFYNSLIEQIKNHKNAVEPKNEKINCRMYAICEMAGSLCVSILHRRSNLDGCKCDHMHQLQVPSMHFQRHNNPKWINKQLYLPSNVLSAVIATHLKQMDLQSNAVKCKGTTGLESKTFELRKKEGTLKSEGEVNENDSVSIEAQPMEEESTLLVVPEALRSTENGDKGKACKNASMSKGTTATVPVTKITTVVSEPTQEGDNEGLISVSENLSSGNGIEEKQEELMVDPTDEKIIILNDNGSVSTEKSEGIVSSPLKKNNTGCEEETNYGMTLRSGSDSAKKSRKRRIKSCETELSEDSCTPPVNKLSSKMLSAADRVSRRKSPRLLLINY